jgi:hypothetical protein
VLWLKILGGIVVLAYGLWLGMAGEFRQSPEEIDRAMEKGGGRRRVKRHFIAVEYLMPRRRRSERRARSERRGAFQLAEIKPPPPKDESPSDTPDDSEASSSSAD